MTKPELENLVRIKQLKPEPASRKEYDGMLKSAQRGLADAQNESLDTDSQFDLAIGTQARIGHHSARGLSLGEPHHRVSNTRPHGRF